MIITPTLRRLDALCLRGRQGLRILDIAAFLRRYPHDRPHDEHDFQEEAGGAVQTSP